jgi:hypothetical protein
MIKKVFKIIVALIVGWLVWYAIGIFLVAIHAPAIVGTVVLVLFILLAAWFIWNELGDGLPPKP